MSSFSEREFYLSEFRGRTIAVAGNCDLSLADHIESSTNILKAGGARVVLLSPNSGDISFGRGPEAEIWRVLSEVKEASVRVDDIGRSWPLACAQAVSRLGVSKLVWLDTEGGFLRYGRPVSFVTHLELSKIEVSGTDPRKDLWEAIKVGLESGISSINVCQPDGLEAELFTYAGSGTLFTRESYIKVRPLGIDDYDKAADLLMRGIEEGYLVSRDGLGLDQLLSNGFGAFVQGDQIAGICSLLQYSEEAPFELAGLYTLTRFLGEGVGGHLVAHAKKEAERFGSKELFACTTSERVGAFFKRNGFQSVPWRSLPFEKWEGLGRPYDQTRRDNLLCFLTKL